jgi:hypothetical protein
MRTAALPPTKERENGDDKDGKEAEKNEKRPGASKALQ